MEYPALVYKDGGLNQRPGGTYSWRAVQCDVELEVALSEGYVRTMAELDVVVDVKADDVDDAAAPTRAELEAKASELGIKFDGRTKDAKLLDKIEAALKADNGLE